MLKDTSLKFHPARTRDSIRVRADTLGLTKGKKKKKKGNKTIWTITKKGKWILCLSLFMECLR